MTTDRRPSGAENSNDAALAAPDTSGLPSGTVGIRALLNRSRAQIAAALPKHVTVDRMLRIAMTAVQTTRGLLDCTPLSILGGIVTCAQLGLEVGGPLGHAYLVPYTVNGVKIATFIPGYRGMVDLARRSGAVSTVEARIVHKRDRFAYALGLVPKIDHVPYMGADDPGPAVAVYAVCRLRDGSVQFEVMSARDVEHVRKRSKTAGRDDSPWQSDPDEMWKKTAIRRLWKLLPVSVEKTMAKAIEAHDAAERGEPIDPSAVFAGGVDVAGEDLGAMDGDGGAAPQRRTARREAPAREAAGRDDAREPEGEQGDQGGEAPAEEAKPEKTAKAADPRAELVRELAALRMADPEAFERGADAPDGTAQQLNLARMTTDTLLVVKENAIAWRKAHPKR